MDLTPSSAVDANAVDRRRLKLSFQQQQQAQLQQNQAQNDAIMAPQRPGLPLPEKTKWVPLIEPI